MTDNLERRYPTMTAVTDQDGTPGRDPAGDRRPEADGAFGASVRALPPRAALMVAVDVLLAAPEVLEDDGLESCLYIFREKLLARTTPPPESVNLFGAPLSVFTEWRVPSPGAG